MAVSVRGHTTSRQSGGDWRHPNAKEGAFKMSLEGNLVYFFETKSVDDFFYFNKLQNIIYYRNSLGEQ